jgi:hypothetical protein
MSTRIEEGSYYQLLWVTKYIDILKGKIVIFDVED